MPEVIFTIQLPDGSTRECYSPSSVVCRYFAAGEEMLVAEFLARSREAFTAASETRSCEVWFLVQLGLRRDGGDRAMDEHAARQFNSAHPAYLKSCQKLLCPMVHEQHCN